MSNKQTQAASGRVAQPSVRHRLVEFIAVSAAMTGLPLAPALAAPALPSGGQFVAGAGTIAAAGANGLQINQAGGRGIIDWRNFSIGAGGSVSINNGTGATLNRVTGGQLSTIAGTLSATGSVYLVNPQGVVVGPGGQVLSGGSVVLSSRDMSNDAFMAGAGITAAGTSVGDVTNKGTVLARTGDVVIIGHSAVNTGTIVAADGTVTLAAGNTVVMAPVGGSSGVVVAADASATGDVTEAGRVEAAAAALTAAGGNVYSLAGSAGLIQATGTATIGGHVYLTAPNGAVNVAGTVTARNADGSGGQIIANGAKSTAVSGRLDANGAKGGDILVGVSAPGTNLSQSTTVADGAVITAVGPDGGGRIETSGHTLAMGVADIQVGQGGVWTLDPADLNIDGSTATTIENGLTNGATVNQTGDNVNVNAAIAWNTTATLNLSAGAGNLTVGALGSINGGANGALGLTATGGISIGAAINAKTVSVAAGAGGLSIGAGGKITGTAAGTTAVTLSTTGNFSNGAGAGAVVASGAGANWRIYSTDPNLDAAGGLLPDFYQYNTAAGGGASGSGDGMLYSVAPALSYSLIADSAHATTKVYDGNANLVAGELLTAANISAPDIHVGDAVTPVTGAGTYSQSDVGNSLTVTLTGGVAVTRNGKPVFGYTAGTETNQGVFGAITPASVSVQLVGTTTKTYDSSSTAALAAGNYQVTTPTGDVFTIGQASSAYYGTLNSPTADVSADGSLLPVTATFTSTSFIAQGGAKASNYVFPTFETNNIGIINPAALTAHNVSVSSRSYDGTTSVLLNNPGGITLTGMANDGDVSFDTSLPSITGVFTDTGGAATANAGTWTVTTHLAVVAGNAPARDYVITQPTLTASITPAVVNVGGLGANSKTYDGTTDAVLTGTATESGILANDADGAIFVALNPKGHFAQSDAGTGIAVNVTGYAVQTSGGLADGNYQLAFDSITANINKAILTANLAVGYTPTKTYDGSTSITLDPSEILLTGVANGQSITVDQIASSVFGSANAGQQNVIVGLALTDFVTSAGLNLNNYVLPTGISNGVGAGLINRAPLTIGIIGDPTRTYDGATDFATPALNSANFAISGLVNGETASITTTAGLYYLSGTTTLDGNAGQKTVGATVMFGAGAGGFNVNNYSFAATATGVGHILPATVGIGSPTGVYSGVSGTKVYDATTGGALATNGYNFTFTGLMNGDQITVKDGAITGVAYGSPNAGQQSLTVQLNTAGGTTDFGFSGPGNLSDYSIALTAYGIGTITPALVSASIINNPTKTYNGTSDVALGNGNFQFVGFLNGDGIDVDQVARSFYVDAGGVETVNASANASHGAVGVLADLQSSNVTGTGTTLLSNYSIQMTGITGAGTIRLAPLTVAGYSVADKVYDGSNAAILTAGTVSGQVQRLVGGIETTDQVGLNTPTVSFGSVNVGGYSSANSGATALNVSAFQLTGADAGNYSFTAPTLTASITPRPLFATGVSAVSRDYDGTDIAQLTGVASLMAATANSGVVGSDQVSVDAGSVGVGHFSQSNVGTGLAVSVGGYLLTGAGASNYSLVQPGGLTATINPKQLQITLSGDLDKVYDGTTIGYLTGANFSVTGWATADNEGGDISQAFSTNYQISAGGASLNTSHVTGIDGATVLTATLKTPDYKVNSNTDLSNYIVPMTVSATAHITPAPLVVQIINNPTKVFDDTTNGTDLINTDGTDLLTSANYKFIGLVGSDSLTLSHTGASYSSVNAGIGVITATGIAGGDYTANGLTELTDYQLPTSAFGGGTIKPLQLGASVIHTITKTYDGTTAASLTSGDYSVLDLPDGTQSIIIGKATGTYGSANAGTPGVSVSLAGGDFSAGNGATLLSNYILPTSAIGPGLINPLAIDPVVSKVYDANGSLTGVTYGVTGKIGSDDVSIAAGVTGNYDAVGGLFNVGSLIPMDLQDISLTGGAAGNYTIRNGTFSGGSYSVTADPVGAITPRQLTASLTPQTKVYDTTTDTVTALTAADFLLTGFAGSQRAEVDGVTAGHYNSKDVDATSVTSDTIGAGNYADVGGSGFLAGNYILPTSATGLGTITQAIAHITLTSAEKTYDGTNALQTLDTTYTISGVLGNDVVGVGSTMGTFDSVHVGSGIGINVSSITLNGAESADYVADIPAAHDPIGKIDPAKLTLTISGSVSKPYDGTTDTNGTAAQMSAADFAVLSGLQPGDSVTINSTAEINQNTTFDSRNVSTLGAGHNGLTLNGLTLADVTIGGIAQAGDYIIAGTATGLGTISPVSLSGVLSTQSKTYDGNTDALNLNTLMYTLTGLVHGETATVGRTSGAYNDPNVGLANTVSVTGLTGSDFTATGGSMGTSFLASNYIIDPTISGPGSIGAKGINLASVTKVYDASHDLNGAVYLLNGVVGQDDVSVDAAAVFGTGAAGSGFSTQNVASLIPMTLGGIALTGAEANDYSIASTSNASIGIITPHSLTVTLSSQTKVYDGLLALTGITSGSYTVTGLAGSEQATIEQGDGVYNDLNVLGATTVTAALAAGNYFDANGSGFLASNYTIKTSVQNTSSTITPRGLTGVLARQTKVYDGNTGALNLTTLMYTLTGLQNGETATVGRTSGAYNDPNVTLANMVSVTGLGASDFTSGGVGVGGTGFLASNYTLPGAISGLGSITPATLTASLTPQNKVYDGNALALLLTTGSYTITGVNGETATIDRTQGAYDTANVGAVSVTVGAGGAGNAALTAGDFSATGGTAFDTSNYNLPTTISGLGSISKATLTASLAQQNKVYDGNDLALLLSNSSYTITGVNGETATVDRTQGAYDTANVGAVSVTVGAGGAGNAALAAGDFSATGGTGFLAGNYNLPTTISGLGSISQASLTAASVTATKVYDGNANETHLTNGSYTIVGVNGETATVDATSGTYNDPNVAFANSITVTGLTAGDYSATGGTGFLASNYTLPGAISGLGTITKASLTASLAQQNKVYDGNALALLLTTGSYTITGVNGETATVDRTQGAYDTANVGAVSVTVGAGGAGNAALTAGDFSATGGTGFDTSNYTLPTTISGLGKITPASLTAASVTATKVYDGNANETHLTNGSYTIVGVNGETATVDATSGTYNDPNVAFANSITVGGLTAGDYSATGGTAFLAGNYTLPATLSGLGTITPAALGATLGAQIKPYDGNTGTTATLVYNFTGLVNGETVQVDRSTADYNDPNVALAAHIIVAGLTSGDFSAPGVGTGGTSFVASNYSLPTSIVGGGTITPLQLTASFADTTKQYNATLITSLLTGYVLDGFIAGQSGAIGDAPSTGLYGVKDVTASPQNLTVSLASASFAPGSSTDFGNYVLPTIATGLGTITQAPLTITGLTVSNKVYDGTTAATLNGSGASSLAGVFANDQVTLNVGPNSAQFVSPNVGNGVVVNLSGGSIAGQDAGDYFLVQMGALAANITPKPLTASIIGDPTKTYDGNAGAVLTSADYALLGFVAGQGGVVTQTVGTYASPNAGAEGVTAALGSGTIVGGSGTLLSNYILPTSASGTGLINQAVLTATIVGDPTKTFDGNTGATLNGGNFDVTGFVGGEGASVTQTAGTYAASDPGRNRSAPCWAAASSRPTPAPC
jgi:filamentous hemagglutinin family protein